MSFKKIISIGIGVVSLSMLNSQIALAENQLSNELVSDQSCRNIIAECFASTGFERASCFYSASSHPLCEGSELGKVAYKRWSMAPSEDPMNDSSPALLGPQLVDQECIASFDVTFEGALKSADVIESKVTGEASEEHSEDIAFSDAVRGLSSSLDSCKRDLQLDLVRP